MKAGELSSIAIRVHNVDAMTAFFSEAFGIEFAEVDTFGITSRFGAYGDLTIKLVPIRDEPNFDEFPVHQLGFVVDDVEAVVEIARKHGGKLEGEIVREENKVSAAVRDPDGNTIEMYSK
jgi:catechol 2,3-dioxygenase-like lactoylglutathione lyase family enzyme